MKFFLANNSIILRKTLIFFVFFLSFFYLFSRAIGNKYLIDLLGSNTQTTFYTAIMMLFLPTVSYLLLPENYGTYKRFLGKILGIIFFVFSSIQIILLLPIVEFSLNQPLIDGSIVSKYVLLFATVASFVAFSLFSLALIIEESGFPLYKVFSTKLVWVVLVISIFGILSKIYDSHIFLDYKLSPYGYMFIEISFLLLSVERIIAYPSETIRKILYSKSGNSILIRKMIPILLIVVLLANHLIIFLNSMHIFDDGLMIVISTLLSVFIILFCSLYIAKQLFYLEDNNQQYIFNINLINQDLELKIQERTLKLKEWSQLLEQRVKERTEDLASLNEKIIAEIIEKESIAKRLEEKTIAMQHAIEGISLCDKNGKYVYVNPAYENILGRKSNNIIGENWSNFFDKDNQIPPIEEVQSILSNNGKYKNVFSITKGSRKIFIEVICVHSVSSHELENFYSFATDITSIIETEQSAIKNREKSKFIAYLSHEIRTPLNGILATIELFSEQTLTKEQKEYVDMLKISGEYLGQLINDVLDISKLEAGKMSISNVEFELRHSIGELCRVFTLRAEQKHLRLNYKIDSDLSEYIIGNWQHIRQILTNLLGNSIKFTDSGEIGITVKEVDSSDINRSLLLQNHFETYLNHKITNEELDSKLIEFSVYDTGIGISKENQDKIFDAFVQANSDDKNNRYHGEGTTGLGLSISTELAKLMHGMLMVESKRGFGSKFSLFIPLEISHKTGGVYRNSDKLVILISTDNNWLDSIYSLLCYMKIDSYKTDQLFIAVDLYQKNIGKEIFFILDYDAISSDTTIDRTLNLMSLLPSKDEIQDNVVMLLPFNDQNKLVAKCKSVGIRKTLIKPLCLKDLEDLLSYKPNQEPKQSKKESVRFEGITDKNKKILLVEDNEINSKVAISLLKKQGYHNITTAINGKDGIDSYIINSPDIVLMDIQMPVMDGFSSAKAIRDFEVENNKKPAFIIAMTASALDEDKEKCLNVGMNAYISKPITSKSIEDILAKSTPTIGYA